MIIILSPFHVLEILIIPQKIGLFRILTFGKNLGAEITGGLIGLGICYVRMISYFAAL